MRRPFRRKLTPRQYGGTVSVTPQRDRIEPEERFTVSYHYPGGDLAWLSPAFASIADAAARTLADFLGAVIRR